MIADLTGKNANVFYELGLAHALGNNVIALAQKIEEVPFDVASYRVIQYDNTIAGGKKLERQIELAIATLDEWSKKPSNPVQDFLPPEARPVPSNEHEFIRQALEETQKELSDTKAKLTGYEDQEAELQHLKDKHEAVKRALEEAQKESSDTKEKLAERENQEDELQRLTGKYKAIKQNLEETQKELSNAEAKLVEYQNQERELRRLQQENAALRRIPEPTPAKSEWECLRDDIEDYGLRDGVHDVLHFSDKAKQVEAWKKLAAMVENPDQEAIEDYLGSLTPDGMALIPAGKFLMGSEAGLDSEKPVHRVHVDAFYMDIYEVTNEQFKTFTDANPQWSKDQIPEKYHDSNYLSN